MSALRDLIERQIASAGPMRLDAYMEMCLTHPAHGYYTTRDPLGAAGDFTTAPEISQMFGEMIGLWLAQTWVDQGRPQGVLAEIGPGRGTLMADVLRTTAKVPGFHDAMDVHLIDVSPSLQAVQAKTLLDHDIRWSASLNDLPDAPLFLLANEFFDALPIRQFQRDGTGWRERMVGPGLTPGLSPVMAMPVLDQRFGQVSDGTLVEISEPSERIARDIGARIGTHGGAALIIDYGDWAGTGDTFQALASHEMVDPFATPGEADLTAHVQFGLLAEAAGVKAGFATQGVFLERLGITARANALARGPDVQKITDQHKRLTHPSEMGSLFKVLGLTTTGSPPLTGLDEYDA